MATYEVYVGGPGRGDYSRSQYPAKAFSAADATFKKLRVAAHKGPTMFSLTRTLDFKNDHALAEFVRNQAAAGAPLAAGDKLGSIIIPARTLLFGVYTRVENAVTGVTLTLSTRAPNAIAFGTIAGGTADDGIFRVAGEAANGITEGAVNLGTPATGVGAANFANVPRILDVTLTAIPAGGLGALRVHISPLISELEEGQF
jgi:hypothetical protein